MQLSSQHKQQFLDEVWEFYDQNGRHDLPWRTPDRKGVYNPYHILVSEVMLQQTQVARVIEKYEEFLQVFPTVGVLAEASLGDVLRMWQGLGYNRRAKYLWETAKIIKQKKEFPSLADELVALPGVGVNTAGAVMAYAFNSPALFVETNVRTVYIHHFFADESAVKDTEIIELVRQTVDKEHTREFYWALMDYGSYLKKHVRNNFQSKHYVKQSKFEGSNRQIRGMVLRELSGGEKSLATLAEKITDKRLTIVIETLEQEQMITRKGTTLTLS